MISRRQLLLGGAATAVVAVAGCNPDPGQWWGVVFHEPWIRHMTYVGEPVRLVAGEIGTVEGFTFIEEKSIG